MPVHATAFVHPLAFVAGDVTLGPRASVWPMAVVRGDTAAITIGADTNVQDGTVVHVDMGVPCVIGERVAIGHRAIVHGATVEHDALIGMGAILLNRVVVGAGSIVGAGAVCPEGMRIPPNSLVLGVPARVVRETSAAERERIRRTVDSYLALQESHRNGEYARLGVGGAGIRAAAGQRTHGLESVNGDGRAPSPRRPSAAGVSCAAGMASVGSAGRESRQVVAARSPPAPSRGAAVAGTGAEPGILSWLQRVVPHIVYLERTRVGPRRRRWWRCAVAIDWRWKRPSCATFVIWNIEVIEV